jgi:hypothetical protein
VDNPPGGKNRPGWRRIWPSKAPTSSRGVSSPTGPAPAPPTGTDTSRRTGRRREPLRLGGRPCRLAEPSRGPAAERLLAR